MDPLEGVDPSHDTTYILMRECENRGGEIWTCRSADLVHTGNQLTSTARRVTVDPEKTGPEIHFEWLSEQRQQPTADFELAWMREDPPFDQQYLYATYLLDEASVPVLNDPTGLRNSNEKLLILKFPELIPDTWVGASVDRAENFLERVGEGVAKTLSGYGGEEVYRVNHNDSGSVERLRSMTDNGETPIILQEFLPGVLEEGDRRLILLGGEPIGGLTRYPADGDFRANLHSGGRAGDVHVTDTEENICEQIKPVLLERGLHLVGLDLIDDQITEINVTSPTCVQEINRIGDMDLDRKIVDYAERKIL